MRNLALVALLLATPASAQLTQHDLAGAVARPAPGTPLPAALRLATLDGKAVRLGDVAAGAPLVLMFADFTCKHLCGPGLALAAGALHDSGLVPGRDYRLAIIGLDPKDGAAAARHFAEPFAATPDVARAAIVLRGDPATVVAATGALRYGYVYDAANDQYAHDASIYVFARDGRLAALLPEMALTPAMLRQAVSREAPADSFSARVAHVCYGLSALTGRFDRPVVLLLQLASAIALAAGGLFLLRRRAAA